MVQYTLMRGFVVTVLLAALAASVATLLRDREGQTLWQNVEKLRPLLALDGVPVPLVLGGAALWALIVVELVLGLMALIGTVILEAPPGMAGAGDASGAWRFRLAQVAALTAVLGAVVALPVTLRRLQLTRAQTATAEESLFNIKITEAASGLYTQRQVTRRYADGRVRDEFEDDVVRRNVAIDRLEGLVEERSDTADRVARMLSVYARELSRQFPPATAPTNSTPEHLRHWGYRLRAPRSDMQNVVQVLGRLAIAVGASQNEIYIDLRGSNLQKLDFGHPDMKSADFRGAHLQAADLSFSKLNGSDFTKAHMQGATFNNAQLVDAQFLGGLMQGAHFFRANLRGASFDFVTSLGVRFDDAQMQGTHFHGTQMQGAKLYRAQLQGALFRDWDIDEATDFTGAEFRGAALRSMGRGSIPEIFNLSDMFGDGTVQLTESVDPRIERPAHWPRDRLDDDAFRKAWRAWQRERGWEDLIPKDE